MTLGWVKDYYTRQSRTFGRAVITDHNLATAAMIDRWCRERDADRRILELGAGAGGNAAALADLGYEVWAVEFNPSDAAFARELAGKARAGSLRVLEEDFYKIDLGATFDSIFYWDGFGIGTDADQRRLLKRIGTEWLTPRGCALLDVFSPWNWMKRAGETKVYTARDGTEWRRTVEYDAIGNRIIDLWSGPDNPTPMRSQTIRCYSIPDLELLLDGTELMLDRVTTMGGDEIDPSSRSAEIAEQLLTTNGYFAFVTPFHRPEQAPGAPDAQSAPSR